MIVILFRALQFAAWTGQTQWGYDFSAYWAAAGHLINGESPYQAHQLAGSYPPQQQYLYLYPPALAVAFVPGERSAVSAAKDGTIRVQSKDKPSDVKLWQASNPGARDFRLTSIGAKWKSTPLTAQSNGEYVAKIAPPKHGWTAYMVELTFPSGLALAPFKFTTGVKVIPDIEPFAEEKRAAK